jgi:hypothetical protein
MFVLEKVGWGKGIIDRRMLAPVFGLGPVSAKVGGCERLWICWCLGKRIDSLLFWKAKCLACVGRAELGIWE